jgi:hypothetical protein
MSHATKPARFPVAGHPQRARVPARIILAYAAGVYLVFLAVLGYAAGFFAGLDVPEGIDQGPRAAVPVAAAIDLLLLAVFAVQHTVMARGGQGRPEAVRRSPPGSACPRRAGCPGRAPRPPAHPWRTPVTASRSTRNVDRCPMIPAITPIAQVAGSSSRIRVRFITAC